MTWKGPIIIIGTLILVLAILLIHERISPEEPVAEMSTFYIDGQIFKLEAITWNEYGLPKFGIIRGRIVKLLRDGPHKSKNYFEPLDQDSVQYFEQIKTDYFEMLKTKHLSGNE